MSKFLPNAKHEQFAVAIASGASAAEAYRRAGYSAAHAVTAGPRLAKAPGVVARIQALRETLAEASDMKRADVVEWLGKVIRRKEEASAEQLRAVEILNRMTGWNEPEKIEHSGNFGVVAAIHALVNTQKS